MVTIGSLIFVDQMLATKQRLARATRVPTSLTPFLELSSRGHSFLKKISLFLHLP